MPDLKSLRAAIYAQHLMAAKDVLLRLSQQAPIADDIRQQAVTRATDLVRAIRSDTNPGLMEVFLAEYGLSTNEGVALMCLAEALLRVPDAGTIDALIEDKIAPSSWGAHLGKSSSSLVNASTWALMLTGKVLRDDAGEGVAATLHSAIKRLGEPVIRTAVQRAIRELGHQFVLGRTIDEALNRGRKLARQGFTFSYDMLGEAALTAADAQKYFKAYSSAIADLAGSCKSDDIRQNPGISVKLSALHPRYERGQKAQVMAGLVDVTRTLARQARRAGMGFNIDAEEADRLDLSLDVIEAVLRDPDLAGWGGFGVVVQTYGKSAGPVIDWLYALADGMDRKIMVRLVKGAYWDSEIKLAQTEGLAGFPVFTRKAESDVSYILCAKKLLRMGARIYPQFATHNAHSVAAILAMATDVDSFEFQRLQGMGESLHAKVLSTAGTRCRIYAPVGTHRDLLAYLVRRLLENGANSSFVNQIVDKDIAPEIVAADPFAALDNLAPSVVRAPGEIFGPARQNSRGFNLRDNADLALIAQARRPFKARQWQVAPLLAGSVEGGETHAVINPADGSDQVGEVTFATDSDVETALFAARDWSDSSAAARADILRAAADLFAANFGEFFAILCREAGKTQLDAVSELREAVDFLRYYAGEAENLPDAAPRGIIAAISPWNFPLAIFTGQIAAALATGNGVIAKPAEATAITADIAVKLLHRAGVPGAVLQLLPGRGATVGARITADARVGGVVFTGSTATALAINRVMAPVLVPDAPLIAETGGLNAMIVDSTALPEQAIRDILASAFQSAGQRCSALRMLYLQEDVAEDFLEMLFGAMDELVVGDPWVLATYVGPVIDEKARASIVAHIETARAEGRVLKQITAPESGIFVAPTVIQVTGITDLKQEIFGPVLHVAAFKAAEIDAVVDAINASGYGLTFGMHSRIDDRVEQVTSRLRVGNIYVNRNQIGAVVGAQPFGGEGLSGTGPKAGGPNYVPRFTKSGGIEGGPLAGDIADTTRVQAALDRAQRVKPPLLSRQTLPGPTGESNQLSNYGRGTVLCLGPGPDLAEKQVEIAVANGCQAVVVAAGSAEIGGIDGVLAPGDLARLTGFDVVALWADTPDQRAARVALASRPGRILALACGLDLAEKCRVERHICIDTTAAGGNASLLAAAG